MNLFPYQFWPANIQQASPNANNNALRAEVLGRDVISFTVSAQPASPADYDLYVIPTGKTGAQWATFADYSMAIFLGGTWYEFVPVSGIIKYDIETENVYRFNGATWDIFVHSFIRDLLIAADGAAARSAIGAASTVGGENLTVSALSISSGVVNIDCSLGKNFTLVLSENVTSITFSNLNGAGNVTEIEVQISQDGAGGRTVALPAEFKALGGSDTAVALGANAVTVLSAKTFDNGTTWRYAMQESA